MKNLYLRACRYSLPGAGLRFAWRKNQQYHAIIKFSQADTNAAQPGNNTRKRFSDSQIPTPDTPDTPHP